MTTTLEGRRVLITGGSTGIGAALAAACHEAGARVGILARNEQRLKEVAAHTGAVGVAADIGDREQVDEAVREIAGQLGGLDALVNNAGIMFHSRQSEGRVDDWVQMVQINVLGPMFVTNAALPFLKEAGFGDIVNIASVAADGARAPEFAVYAATKAAVMRLTEGLRAELEPLDIRVTAVKPAQTKTPGYGPGVRDPKLRQQVEDAKNAIGMEPATVAAQIVRLIGMERGAVVGEVTLLPYNPGG